MDSMRVRDGWVLRNRQRHAGLWAGGKGWEPSGGFSMKRRRSYCGHRILKAVTNAFFEVNFEGLGRRRGG